MTARRALACLTVAAALMGTGHALVARTAAAGASGQTLRWTFDADPAGRPPRDAVVLSGMWMIRTPPDAPGDPRVLCQTGKATFPAIVLGNASFSNITLSARFKPVSGREDRAAGLIFRVQDTNNYYILRANALEDNVNIYVYAGGVRHQLKVGYAAVPSGRWQTLRVEASGPQIRGFLNNRPVVDATDTTYTRGRIGLWTKADSVTCFDDVVATGQ